MKKLVLLSAAALAFSLTPIDLAQVYSDELIVTAYKSVVYKF